MYKSQIYFTFYVALKQIFAAKLLNIKEGKMNKVVLKGNVGIDPKPILTEAGTKGVKFTMATTELIKKRDSEIKEEVTWHNIVAWNSKILFPDRIKKGAYIEVTGKLRYNRFRGQDGIDRYFTEIVAQNITIPQFPAPVTDSSAKSNSGDPDSQLNL